MDIDTGRTGTETPGSADFTTTSTFRDMLGNVWSYLISAENIIHTGTIVGTNLYLAPIAIDPIFGRVYTSLGNTGAVWLRMGLATMIGSYLGSLAYGYYYKATIATGAK